MNWYLKVLRQYVDFNGRARRKEYWMFTLFNILISLGFLMLDMLLFDHDPSDPEDTAILRSIYSLAVLLPGLAVSVRRLHDINRSGWWMMILFVPVIAAAIVGATGFVASGILIVFGIVILVAAIVLLVFHATEGTKGPNKYGPDPKNPGATNDQWRNTSQSNLHTDWD